MSDVKKEAWEYNQVELLLLGFSPILIATNSFSNALVLASATTVTLILSTGLAFFLKKIISPEIKLLSLLIIISFSTTITELLAQAYTFEHSIILESFFPLIATNFLILIKMEKVLKNNNTSLQMLHAAKIGLIGFLILLPLGFIRELVGTGELFSNMDLFWSPAAIESKFTAPQFFNPLIIITLPSGAFIFCGLLLAIYNLIRSKIHKS